MDLSSLLFISSGLFLGWSLGANDAANVFGVAVGTRMIRFKTAAIVCSVFLIIGALVQGGAGANTISSFSKVSTMAGAFVIALSAALVVYNMVKIGLPSSISQAIIGSIVGWSLFAHSDVDVSILTKIVLTWVFCPLLAGVIAIFLYKCLTLVLKNTKIHLLRLDHITRIGLLITGAFGAYSLGANNIGNVMGVFINVSPFSDTQILGYHFSALNQLIFIASIAIASGVISYSKNNMMVVGTQLSTLTPLTAWVVVSAHSLVLFIFSSQSIAGAMESINLGLLLIPVSSTQCIIGAIVGLGLLTNRESIRWSKVSMIVVSWLVTPFFAGLICYLLLFFMQNVFDQVVI